MRSTRITLNQKARMNVYPGFFVRYVPGLTV